MANGRGLLGLFADSEEAAAIASAPDTEITPPPAVEADAAVVALVNNLKGTADPAVGRYEFVREGQRIDLGSGGELHITLLSPCREERITGGEVTVTAAGAQSDVTARRQTKGASCRAVGNRTAPPDEGPFRQSDWIETTVNGRPIFKWAATPVGETATVTVWSLDDLQPQAIWSAQTPFSYIAYPASAATLVQDLPYRVDVEIPGTPARTTRFSLDFDLNYSRTPLNRMIWLDDIAGPQS